MTNAQEAREANHPTPFEAASTRSGTMPSAGPIGRKSDLSSPPEPDLEQPASADENPPIPDPLIRCRRVNFAYQDTQVLNNITMDIARRGVTALIGPSGCGKSTLLRCFNRMNDLIDGAKVTGGKITIAGTDIYDSRIDVIELRRRVGIVFQKSNPFPKTIYENVAYGMRVGTGRLRKSGLDDAVEAALKRAGLWDEVKDRLQSNALALSGGQQQRLCIARAIAVNPDIILMDEPCSALDPIATAKIEELIAELKDEYTIVIVTHNMQQATRCSDWTAFFYLGALIEYDETPKFFSAPRKKKTEDYITGRFG